MTQIDIISGFLGAGKTTLIKKLLKESYAEEQVVLIENEFGEIGIDGGFLKDAGVEITEMNSGCICCSLVGDFSKALKEVFEKYHPDRLIIEPSGVGKLSDVKKAVVDATKSEDVTIHGAIAVVDAKKCKVYLKNFGEFFKDQIANASTVILSRTSEMPEEKVNAVVEIIRELNEKAAVITTPWELLSGNQIVETMDHAINLEEELLAEMHHDHHHHEHGEECTCGCHHEHEHHHEEHECCHDDHDHHHHDHHHEHGEECTCGCHHEHHHADEVFTSIGIETSSKYTKEELETILSQLEQNDVFGFVLRAKGMLPTDSDKFLHFDYVPGEFEMRQGATEYIGKICVIGSDLKEMEIKNLFK